VIEEIEFISLIERLVRNALEENMDQSVAHRYDHSKRVCKRAADLAQKIGIEDVDLEVLKIAALLHDIDQPYYDKENHVERSLQKAKQILLKVGYPQEKVKKVLEIIGEHSSEDERLPSSLEAKILFDADKLDGLGAVGIARVFSFCGQKGKSCDEALRWYEGKIKKAAPMMQTEAGKNMAAAEMEFVRTFFEKYRNEAARLK